MKKVLLFLVAVAVLCGGWLMCRSMSTRLVDTRGGDARESGLVFSGDVVASLRMLAKRIPAVDNAEERHRLASSALKAMSELDISKMTLEDRKKMIAENFFMDGVVSFASSIKGCGVSEEEMGNWMMAGWQRYRDLCDSFCVAGDSCTEVELRISRELARKSKQYYANDYKLMESLLIGLLFGDMPDGAEERFRSKWKASFADPSAGRNNQTMPSSFFPSSSVPCLSSFLPLRSTSRVYPGIEGE